MPIINGRDVGTDQLKEYTILLNPWGADFKDWTQLVEACRAQKITTFSTCEHRCPKCETDVPGKWYVFIREEDKEGLV